MTATPSSATAGNRERAGSTSLWVNIADLTIQRNHQQRPGITRRHCCAGRPIEPVEPEMRPFD